MFIRSIAVASAGLAVLAGGTTSQFSDPGINHATTSDSVFWGVRTVALHEPEDNPIGEVTDLEVLPDGRILILDRLSYSLRLYDENGFPEKTVGRRGEGPGEFRFPNDLAVNTAGQVFVSDIGLGRFTRFTPDLEYDTTFTVPGQLAAGVKAAGDRILALTYRRFEDNVLILDFDGRILGSFHPFEPETFSVPYWEAISRPFIGVGTSQYYVATAPLYPIRQYSLDGAKLPDFGVPPRSWIEPVRPKYGAFVGLNREERLKAWAESFSIISGIHGYGDDLVLVTHGGFEGTREGYITHDRTMDIYDSSGSKILEDVPLPGRVLSVGKHIAFLTSEPPGPWFVRVCQIRIPGHSERPQESDETHPTLGG